MPSKNKIIVDSMLVVAEHVHAIRAITTEGFIENINDGVPTIANVLKKDVTNVAFEKGGNFQTGIYKGKSSDYAIYMSMPNFNKLEEDGLNKFSHIDTIYLNSKFYQYGVYYGAINKRSNKNISYPKMIEDDEDPVLLDNLKFKNGENLRYHDQKCKANKIEKDMTIDVILYAGGPKFHVYIGKFIVTRIVNCPNLLDDGRDKLSRVFFMTRA